MKAFITGAGIVTVAIAISFICAYKWVDHTYRHEIGMHQTEIDAVIAELQRRAADDCECVPTAYGYKCTEKTGKVFKVVMR